MKSVVPTVDVEPLYRQRSPSLGVLSFDLENLHPHKREKFVAESVYLLQQPAHDCSLVSLSGNQLRSRVPIPLAR